jgi:hypothetical protein|tara:strand:+ start:2037 stop:2210 length:174 start_codon:yes stop_codon:yes gene_type:complete
MSELTKQIGERIWKNYMTIKGGDFQQWYNGMSPIEQGVFRNLLEGDNTIYKRFVNTK